MFRRTRLTLLLTLDSTLAIRGGTALERRERADLALAIAMSVQEQEPGPRDVCSAPPATIYPPLHGTLLTDTTPTNATSISDTHQQSMQPSNGSVQSSATEINNPRNRVNSVRHTSSVEGTAATAVVEDISYCSTYPRPVAQLQTDGTGLATRVSEIESFTSSSSKQHASGHAKHLDANISLDASGTVDSVSSVSDSEGDTTGQSLFICWFNNLRLDAMLPRFSHVDSILYFRSLGTESLSVQCHSRHD